MKTVIFACIHNAGRSQMAAAWFNALASGSKARAISAGTNPGARVHPEVLQAMQQDAGQPLAELRVDGGAAANDLLLQIQADLLGVPVLRPRVTETTALGAAYLAGLAVGFWQDEAELAAQWQIDRRFEPSRSADWRAAQLAGWRRAVQRSLRWAEEA